MTTRTGIRLETGPTRRQVATRVAILIGIAIVVFGVILPRVVDIDQANAALAGLSGGQLALLAAAAVLGYVANAFPSRLLVPGLTWPRAVGADLAARAVASTIPEPTDVATRYVLYRQWQVPGDVATSGIVLMAFFETLSALALPAIAVAGLLVVGRDVHPTIAWLSIACLAVLAVALVTLSAIVRSDRAAQWLGALLQRVADKAWGLVRRKPPRNVEDAIVDIRDRLGEVLTRHGAPAFAAAVLAKLAWFLVLEVALWAVGIGPDVLPPSVVLAAMTAVALVALLPITPGAIGVSEVAYVGLLTTATGDAHAGQVAAAIVLFRLVQWLVPIPVGWILLVVMRGSHWREFVLDEPDGAPAAA